MESLKIKGILEDWAWQLARWLTSGGKLSIPMRFQCPTLADIVSVSAKRMNATRDHSSRSIVTCTDFLKLKSSRYQGLVGCALRRISRSAIEPVMKKVRINGLALVAINWENTMPTDKLIAVINDPITVDAVPAMAPIGSNATDCKFEKVSPIKNKIGTM